VPIPEHILIGNMFYRVVQNPNVIMNMQRNADTPFRYGELDPWNQEIRISPDTGPDMARIGLLHEITHGLLSWCDEEVSESIVNAVANGIYQLFRDNPSLYDYIYGER
jgi:hypothetical protein